MTIGETVFWGVVSGVITSAVIFLAGLLVTRILIPWYLALVYQGVDLRGQWIEQKTWRGATYTYQVTLKQTAHRLKGEATITKAGSGADDYTQNFSVEGSTWEGFVTLILRSTDRTRLSFVAALLKVGERGQKLDGHWAYRSRSGTADAVQSEELHWSRST